MAQDIFVDLAFLYTECVVRYRPPRFHEFASCCMNYGKLHYSQYSEEHDVAPLTPTLSGGTWRVPIQLLVSSLVVEPYL